jgi:hypothetical protein
LDQEEAGGAKGGGRGEGGTRKDGEGGGGPISLVPEAGKNVLLAITLPSPTRIGSF